MAKRRLSRPRNQARKARSPRRRAARAGSALRAPITVDVLPRGISEREFFGIGYVHNELLPDRRTNWPVDRGLPLPRGAVRDVNQLALRSDKGKLVPRQVRPLATWPDGSVMFAHVAWQCDVTNTSPAKFTLETKGGVSSPLPAQPVAVEDFGDEIRIRNGPLEAHIRRGEGSPALRLSCKGEFVLDGEIELWTVDAQNRRHRGVIAGPSAVRVVEAGPLVGVVEITGQHKREDGGVFLDFVLRLRFDAGRAELKLSHTFINLGDEPEGVSVGEIGLKLRAGAAGGPPQHIVRQTASGVDSFSRFAEFPEDADITIGKAGPRIANPAILREDTTGYPPYVLPYLEHVDHWVGLRTPRWTAITFLHEATQNWPKRIIARGGEVEYHLWPAGVGAQVQDLRQGMARTHHIQWRWREPNAPLPEMQAYVYQIAFPANAHADFSWYQKCKVFGMEHVMPFSPRKYPLLEGRFLAMMERGGVTGMLNYGDDPDSGYSASYAAIGVTTSTVWINNEHDFMSQAVIQFWRSGRAAAWKTARIVAEHQIDVDFVRKSADRWKQGAIPAHSHLHTTAAAYPSHCWTEGLLHYYLSSGDDRALEVARGIGRLLCQYVEERYHVMAVESRMEGWALIALAALVEVTRDERCLRAARTIEKNLRQAVNDNGTIDPSGLNYGTGTVLTGLSILHRATGSRETLKLMLRILDWHLKHGRNLIGIPWSDQLRPYDLNLTLPAYAYAYHTTRKSVYRREGLNFLRFTGPPAARSDIRGSGKCYRTYMPFIKIADEAGVLKEIDERIR